MNREHPPIEALFERLASLPEVEAILQVLRSLVLNVFGQDG